MWTLRTGRIVGGHQRVKAAEAEGLEALPVVRVDLDEPSEKQLNLALNRIAGQWDDEKLREVLASLQAEGADLGLTGFEDAELERLLQRTRDGFTDPDDAPEVPTSAVSQPGDLWLLGPHRLLCGDATSAADVARLLGGERPMLTVTDPPYGVNYDPAWRDEAHKKGQINYGAQRLGRVENDHRSLWREAWALLPGSVAYVWHAGLDDAVGADLDAEGFERRAQIIWRKPHFVISRGSYHAQHEPCWYAVRKGSKADWIGDRSQSTIWEATFPNDPYGNSPDSFTHHGTQKPVELFRRAIANHRGDVYEPFAGSGTCVIASEQLERRCFAMEIHPPYCDVIVERWQAFTGKAATHEDGEPFDVRKAHA